MAASLNGKAAVVGIGETAYLRGSDKSALALQLEASLRAVEDAGLEPKDIDGILPYASGAAVAEDFITNFGLEDVTFSATTPMGGASCVAAIQAAAIAVATGLCRNVLLPIGRRGYSDSRVASRVAAMPQFHVVSEFETPSGTIAPAQLYAPMARRHMELYGTTADQFAEVAVTMRRHAMLNDNAIMQKPMSVEDHHASRMICDPYRLFDCCLESDGGAAIVISGVDRAADTRRPVPIMGVAEGHPDSPSVITQRPDITRLGLAKAAPRAFGMAGVGPGGCGCRGGVRLLHLDGDLPVGGPRLLPQGRGRGLRRGRQDRPRRDALPVNTHGGLLSQAHIVGMNHVCELVKQMRGEAGRAQVADAEIGLVTGYGDLGDGSVAIMGAAA